MDSRARNSSLSPQINLQLQALVDDQLPDSEKQALQFRILTDMDLMRRYQQLADQKNDLLGLFFRQPFIRA